MSVMRRPAYLTMALSAVAYVMLTRFGVRANSQHACLVWYCRHPHNPAESRRNASRVTDIRLRQLQAQIVVLSLRPASLVFPTCHCAIRLMDNFELRLKVAACTRSVGTQ